MAACWPPVALHLTGRLEQRAHTSSHPQRPRPPRTTSTLPRTASTSCSCPRARTPHGRHGHWCARTQACLPNLPAPAAVHACTPTDVCCRCRSATAHELASISRWKGCSHACGLSKHFPISVPHAGVAGHCHYTDAPLIICMFVSLPMQLSFTAVERCLLLSVLRHAQDKVNAVRTTKPAVCEPS